MEEGSRNMSPNTTDPKPLPESGLFRIADWAQVCKCSLRSITRDIETFKIQTTKCCGTTIIDASVWWKSLKKGGRK